VRGMSVTEAASKTGGSQNKVLELVCNERMPTVIALLATSRLRKKYNYKTL
jgi:hypothetical protein